MNAQYLLGMLYKRGAVLSLEHGDLLIDAPDDALDDEILECLTQYKAEIVALLKNLDDAAGSGLAPARRDFSASYECEASLAQQRMLFMEELAESRSYYNIPVAYKISGELDKAALFKSLTRLVEHHDVLRTVYSRSDDGYRQRICPPAVLPISEFDISAEDNPQKALETLLQQEANHVFKLDCDWPIKVCLINLGKNEHVLSMNIHHVAADGWSARKIISEIGAGYQLHKNKMDSAFLVGTEREYQYVDYMDWQHGWQATEHYQQAKKYWMNALDGAPQLHSLSTDFIRPAIQTVSGDTYSHTLSSSLFDALRLCASRYKTTPFVILQATFAAFMARYSEETDIVFGTAAANRQPVEFLNTIGLFVNTLVLRYNVAENISFEELIKQAVGVSAGAFRYQQLPFDVLVDELQPARSLGYNPLVQIMLVMQENAAGFLELDGADIVQLKQRQEVSKFDLALHVYVSAEEISFNWEYSTSLFKAGTVKAMAAHFECLLAACLSSPAKNVDSIPLVNIDPVRDVIDAGAYPEARCIHRLIESQAALHPEAIAIRDGAKCITYKELNERASRIANQLYKAGNGEVGRIGLCMEKSSDLIVGMLAIFKVGATYVPLDPYYPKERLEFMIQDSGMGMVLAGGRSNLPTGLEAAAKVLIFETLDGEQVAADHPAISDVGTDAYIIYTSGSTGNPKGVLVSHRNLFYSLHTNASIMKMSHQDVMPTIGSQAFGVSLLEILLPLVSGGAVQVLKKSQISDLEELIKVTDHVSVLHAVPSLMRQWLDALTEADRPDQYPNLRLLLVGGESVPDGLLREIKEWRPNIQLVELYGMTESTVVCSSYEAGVETSPHYCIGKPHSHMRFYVLNRQCQQQPPGVPGELHIGGLSLATEYVNQPQLTAEKFIDNPFSPGTKLYKTGDRVRLLEDGKYEFLGRVDHQVSLRGARIELAEIETLATSVDGVKQAVAHVVELGEHDKTLVLFYSSYVEKSDGTDDLAGAIKACLAQRLPDYMRPSLIQRLDKFPLNPNGKVDRKKLPKPALVESMVEPATEIERSLLTIWQSVLQVDAISVTANFFEIGGHSLMATKLVSKIRNTFSIAFPLSVMFDAPDIRSCAAFIEGAIKEKYAQSLIQKDEEFDAARDEEVLIL